MRESNPQHLRSKRSASASCANDPKFVPSDSALAYDGPCPLLCNAPDGGAIHPLLACRWNFPVQSGEALAAMARWSNQLTESNRASAICMPCAAIHYVSCLVVGWPKGLAPSLVRLHRAALYSLSYGQQRLCRPIRRAAAHIGAGGWI
jgi:hypothetical protein